MEEFEPLRAWQYDIDPLDVCIISELERGASPSTLDRSIKEKYGRTYARSEIERRITRLKHDGFLLKEDAGFGVDPSKLYNHVLLSLIKLPLYVPSAGQFRGWKAAQGKIKELLEEKYKEITILLMFTPEGESAYDICLLVATNSLFKYYQFLEEAGKEALLQSSQTIRAHIPAGFHLNAYIAPSYDEFSKVTKLYARKLPRMKE